MCHVSLDRGVSRGGHFCVGGGQREAIFDGLLRLLQYLGRGGGGA